MPTFYTDDLDIEVDEFLSSCSKYEIKEVIEALVEDGHLPSSVLIQVPNTKVYSRLQQEFAENLDKLSFRYHSITKEDEEVLEKIFKKYL